MDDSIGEGQSSADPEGQGSENENLTQSLKHPRLVEYESGGVDMHEQIPVVSSQVHPDPPG
jgi:hypothetical protein